MTATVATIFLQMQWRWRGWHLKRPSADVLPSQVYSSTSTGLGTSRGTTKTGERWGPVPLDKERGWPLGIHPPTCYTAEFGRSLSNRMGVIWGHKNFQDAEPFGWGCGWPSRNVPSSHLPNWSNSKSVITEIRLKNKQGHGHRNSYISIGYLWLPINVS